ncbi:MAG: DUF1592 domain-containing protein [Pirellulales bacterium]
MFRFRIAWQVAWCVVLSIVGVSRSATALEPAADHVKAFFGRYCTSCHDGAAPEAKLALTTLEPDYLGPTWVRIHDRIRDKRMPPADAPQPSDDERSKIVVALAEQLTKTSAARQRSEGRVALRRMNRREFETTLHDLLGIAIPLQPLLPEDNASHGFDTVSRSLETSSTHLLRYQQAADQALEAALPIWPLVNTTRRWTGREFLDGRPKPNREGTAPFVRFDGDSIILCATLYKHGSVTTPAAPAPGRYRIRASVRAVQTNGQPIPVLLGRISTDRFGHEKLEHLLDIQDAPANATRVLEVERMLPAGEQVYVEGMGLPFFQDLSKQRNGAPVGDDFPGPGLAVDWVELEGPLDAGIGYQRLFGDLPQVPSRYLADALAGKPVPDDWKKWPYPGGEFTKYPLTHYSLDPQRDSERLIRAFLPHAFRRPPTDEQATHYVKIAHDQLAQGVPFHEAMHAAYKAILCSPWFLYYVERPGRLDDYALAARLARFLWNSSPDEDLYRVASSGTLTQSEVLRAETERMLRDRKAARFARAFTDQWLDLGKFHDMKPDQIYVEYDEQLAWAMPEETRRFFWEVLQRDLPSASFMDSNWTFLNARLAKHYGVAGVEGLELRRVSLPADVQRGGVVTHASVLKLTTNASYTSPVKRGAWVLDRLLGQPPPPPPPDVKAVEPDIRGATTIREQLDKHKNEAVCASCHVHIDPPGFALERYDVVGGLRERYRVKQGGVGVDYVDLARYPGKKIYLAKPVECDGTTAAGQSFKDLAEYKKIVLQNPAALTRALAEKLIVYSTGAPLEFADRAEVERIVEEATSRQHGFRSLIHTVVQSPLFTHK